MSTQRRSRRAPALVAVLVTGLVGAAALVAGPASAAGVTYWVDAAAASTGPGTGCGADAAYTTVQAAVTAAGASDIVEVCPGTYAGNVSIASKPGLSAWRQGRCAGWTVREPGGARQR